jgi:hypothetical protein
MAFSQDHCYLVTTVASVVRFQDLNYAVDALSQMILTRSGKDQSYSIQKSRLKGVLRKICESIMLHVVNPGHGVGEIPSELSSLCPHSCNATTFADTIMKITQSSHDILLCCGRFQSGLLSWLLTHFHGSIEVSVSEKRLFEREMEHPTRSLTMIVEKTCQNFSCQESMGKIEVCEKTGNTWRRIMIGLEGKNGFKPATYEFKSDTRESPFSGLLREPIYECKTHYFGLLNKEAKFQARTLASRIIRWLLKISIRAEFGTCLLAFTTLSTTKVHSEGGKAELRIGNLLYRLPRSAQLDFGDEEDTLELKPLGSLPATHFKLEVLKKEPISLDDFVKKFPAIDDYLAKFKKKCMCLDCEADDAPLDFCKAGCLRHDAIYFLHMLIGNSIADGFGINDTSGMLQVEEYVIQVRRLLSQLLDGAVLWNTWFNLATCTALGHSPWLYRESALMPRGDAEAGRTLIAIQYGSMAAAAPWTDLTKELNVKGCFKLDWL